MIRLQKILKLAGDAVCKIKACPFEPSLLCPGRLASQEQFLLVVTGEALQGASCPLLAFAPGTTDRLPCSALGFFCPNWQLSTLTTHSDHLESF